jgi:hypothetical protein
MTAQKPRLKAEILLFTASKVDLLRRSVCVYSSTTRVDTRCFLIMFSEEVSTIPNEFQCLFNDLLFLNS